MNERTKLFTAAALFLSAAAALAFCSPAKAQPVAVPGGRCVTEGAYLASLAENHGELPVFRGTSSAGPVMIVTMSPGGSFTTLIVFPAEGQPDPVACLVNEGEDGVTFNVKTTPKGRQS